MARADYRRPKKKRFPTPHVDRRFYWAAWPDRPTRGRKKRSELTGPVRPMRTWDKAFDRVKSKPGEAAVIATGTSMQVSNLYQGLRRRPDGDDFEMTTSVWKDDKVRLFVRYVGGSDE